ncbi:3-oxoacyl-[acyl-carrier protein] reductase [Aliiroseovarius crassostreae]|uniref:Oxidoreductase n=1 Tax=Aliiroseovarius crassostreae TaxID=154981 RepID=A0A0P7KNL3_9RHOB|nr:SDR family oxidoreductase [Aliiroseovarius crassostreae]KPN63798.1 oxidoreductase [Aliiroseovarius crassostreae]SFU42106.1 3-oxoacyl-[acyl-carrier protein] reductase [Aliiroseovarius crassostreae]
MRKTVLVTGGARGIGRAIADDLARDHHVVITYFSDKAAGKMFAVKHPGSLAIRADFTNAEEPAEVVKLAISAFGKIDAIVNNAGRVTETACDSVAPAEHAALYQVNVTAPAAILAATLPHMPNGSAVVNIASVNAASPPATAGAYAASKAALVAMTKAQAKALGPRGIRVNALAPGPVESAHAPRPDALQAEVRANTALARNGLPSDMVGPTRFLLSDAAGFITGEVLTVSGGYRL